MAVQTANPFPPYQALQKPTQEELDQNKHYADVHNAITLLEQTQKHLEQFSGDSSESKAALIKVREAFGYIEKLRENHEKAEHAKAKAAYDKLVEEGKKRLAESEKEVAEFNEKLVQRAATLVKEQIAAEQKSSAAAKKDPTPPEPN